MVVVVAPCRHSVARSHHLVQTTRTRTRTTRKTETTNDERRLDDDLMTTTTMTTKTTIETIVHSQGSNDSDD